MQVSSETDQQIVAVSDKVELFFGNLSFFCEEKDLIELVQPIADVQSARICRSQRRGNSSLGYGFVIVKNIQAARDVIAAIHGMPWMGRVLRVEGSLPESESIVTDSENSLLLLSSTVAVHVSFFCDNQATKRIDEMSLRELFECHGKVADVMIKRYNTKESGTQGGYGFVYMHDTSAARNAIAALHEKIVDTVQYSCQFSKVSSEVLTNLPKRVSADHKN